jgi:prolyl oligopeptidase
MFQRRPFLVIVLAGACIPFAACQTEGQSQDTGKQPAATVPQTGTGAKITYTAAPRGNVTDDYFGTNVADPYRWLEEADEPGSTEWPKVEAWIEAENKITFSYLESIPQRGAIKDRLTQLWNFERYTAPSIEGGKYFYSKNDGLQNQNVVYVTDTLSSDGRVLIDPNTLRKDGTVALGGMSVTDDAKLCAYGIADAGSDWQTWKVRDVATGTDLEDEIHWVKFGGASWTKDGRGFFYSRFEEPKAGEGLKAKNQFQKIYFHKLGTPQSQDELIYDRKDHGDWYLTGAVTDDGKYLIIDVNPGSKVETGLFYKDLSSPNSPVVELLNKFDAIYQFIDNDGPVFWVKSNLDAPRSRVLAIDTAHPDRKEWKEVVPQGPDAMQGAGVVGEHFIVSYLHDAQTRVRTFDLTGKLAGDVELPGIGTAAGFGGKRKDKETFYTFTSFTTPGAVYRYDIARGKSELYKKPKVGFNPSDYVTEQVFYKSKDGTRIPMFITHKKGVAKDGNNPTLLYGYGGFNIALSPTFSVGNLVWMEMGGVYALANLRGGSEYGEEWHEGGMKLRKQNVFDDFIAAGEYLVREKYTNSKKLAIQGGSNGGLLVGACMTQRPDLYGACLPAVGVMDMLRFQKFTVGFGWIGDYGSSDDADQFKALYAFSPYHNLKAGTCYPPTLVTTADHDDRVYPAHSFKFAAALQNAQGCDNPTLIRIETRAGHGAGKPTSKRIEEIADCWAFLVKSLRMSPAIPGASMGNGH